MIQVTELKKYTHKGCPSISVAEALFLENAGIEGDWHGTGGDRQISILPAEAREWLSGMRADSLCFSTFKENMVCKGLTMEQLAEGSILRINTVVIEITKKYQRCNVECPSYSPQNTCKGLSFGVVFGKVLKGGIIKTGDSIICEK